MHHLTLPMMKHNLRKLIPAGIAVLIGTMFITCTLIFSDAFSQAMIIRNTLSFASSNWQLTIPKQQTNDAEVSLHAVRDYKLDQLNRIAKTQSVAIDGIRVDSVNQIRIQQGDEGYTEIAIPTATRSSMVPLDIVEGHQPTEPGQIAIPKSTADSMKLHIGDRVRTTAKSELDASELDTPEQDVSEQQHSETDQPQDSVATLIEEPLTIVGLTHEPKGSYIYGGAALVTPATFAKFMGLPSFNDVPCSSVFVQMSGSEEAQQQVAEQVQKQLGLTLQSRSEVASQILKNQSGENDAIKMSLLSFGVLSLFVAALVIGNTFQVLVAQRRRTFALLRIIGAQSRQLYFQVVLESALLGLASSVLGVACGIGAMALAISAHVFGTSMTMHVVITTSTLITPIVFGVLATIVASLSAARMATHVTPLEALQPLDLVEHTQRQRVRTVFGTIVLLAGVSLAIWAAQYWKTAENSTWLLAAITGCVLTFSGVGITAHFWIPQLLRLIGKGVSKIGPSAKLAVANIAKNPRRITATGLALLIGVTLISTIGTGAACAKQTMNTKLNTKYSVDISVSGIPNDQAASLKQRLHKEPGIQSVLAAPTAQVKVTDNVPEAMKKTPHGTDLLVMGIPNLQSLKSVLNVTVPPMHWDADQILLSQLLPASGARIQYQPQLTIREYQHADSSDPSEPALTVDTHVLNFRNIVDTGDTVAFVDASLFDQQVLHAQSTTMLIRTDTTAQQSESEIVHTVSNAVPDIPQVSIVAPVVEKEKWNTTVNQVLLLFVVLLAVAVIIALIGVANTLSLSVIERTRETATLRAIGMTRQQVRRSIGIEALLTTVVSSLVGLMLGTGFGSLGVAMVLGPVVHEFTFTIDWVGDAVILGIAIAAALIASISPAQIANRVSPVEALAVE
ncbi:ABC transporter permease [Bifidobacterium dolichotidis]|uniref:ABC transporter permease n=1 Tax=Bifidobacterium dolichotidis TaxID=2306976 RepID=A0A430FSI4_9BIFI|nr:FtsX-like permease family protein [Bifidobacterium dolichotidis]RSX55819.1 ABC transporter permease [Bifidobacterium dolichotidis]